MSQIIGWLQQFNSKERFFLVGQILGNPKFIPSSKFRETLGNALQLQIPETVFSAMDFHLDWLYAALEITKSSEKIHRNDDKMIKAQQEDIDFIIAYDFANTCHIILIEAKGVTGWTNKQMSSKTDRLRDFFGDEGNKRSGVQPHFVLMSPSKPEKLDVKNWPRWMKNDNEAVWIKLDISNDLQSIARCDANGKEDRAGEYWRVIDR